MKPELGNGQKYSLGYTIILFVRHNIFLHCMTYTVLLYCIDIYNRLYVDHQYQKRYQSGSEKTFWISSSWNPNSCSLPGFTCMQEC